MTTTKQNLARLKVLADQAGNAHFERARLAAAVLDDRTYLAANYHGDEGKCLDDLTKSYFKDVAGLMSISELIAIYREFPDESVWKTELYDLSLLRRKRLDAVQARKVAKDGGEKQTRHYVKLAEFEESQEKVQELTIAVKRMQEDGRKVQDEMAVVREDNRRLRRQVQALLGAHGRRTGRPGPRAVEMAEFRAAAGEEEAVGAV